MQIIALQQYTDKYVSLYQGQIRNIPDQIAQKLIEQNIVAEHSSDEGGEGSSSQGDNFFIIKTVDYDTDENTWSRINYTFAEIEDAIINKNLTPFFEVVDGYYIDGFYSLKQFASRSRITFAVPDSTSDITIFADNTIQK